tara:strand:+ start:383 stop:2770 length:2388 start_codon:yes stop_codon:yes gene_type:complete
MADRYTIDIEKGIPLGLRPLARGLGLNDLSNLNPFVSLFARPRDAAARYAEPEKYSPTGQRETMDLVEAGMGPLEALLGVGIGRYLTQPTKQILTSTFTGVDPDVPQADVPSPVGIETLVPTEDLVPRPMQLAEGEVPFAPPTVIDDNLLNEVQDIGPAPRDYDDLREELGGEGDGLIDLNAPTTANNPNYREYGINLEALEDGDFPTEDVGIDIERGLIFSAADGPQSIFERANYDDFVQRFRNTNDDIRGEMIMELMEGSLDLLDTYMSVEDANRVRLGILSDIGMPANDLDHVDRFMNMADVQAAVQAVDAEMIVDPAKSYQYPLMDAVTPFKSKYAEVVQGLKQTKFGSAADFLNFLRNKGVTEAELQARDLTEESLPSGKFDAESLIGKQGIGGGQPLKVTVHTGPNTAYAQHFTPGGRKYSETVITLDNPKIGRTSVASDMMHFSTTQSDAGGPSVVHLRSALFDVVDRRFGTIGEPNPDGLGKAFHVGEIQSQATQDARLLRKSRNRIEEDFGGPQKLSDFAYVPLFEDGSGKSKTLLDAVTEYKDIELVVNNLKNDPNYDPRKARDRTGVSLEDHERFLANTKVKIEKALESKDYGFKTFEDALEYQRKVENLLREDQGIFARDQTISQINELLSQTYGPNTVDDIGIGSLYTTDKTTTIALKHALDQAITLEDADFLTIGTGDMAYSMTGGTLEGQQEYYDEIVPKTFNNLLARLEKENKVKLPRLKTQTIQGTDGEPHVVRGIELTDELKEIFRNPDKGVYAFKTGGQVKLRSGVMSAPGNGMVR